MAVILVDIQVLTMKDITEKERKAKEEIEVMTSYFELFIEISPCSDSPLRRTAFQPQHETEHGNQKEKC